MARPRKVANLDDMQIENEEDKELLRQVQFWKRCYKQRHFFLTDRDLVAKGREACKVLRSLFRTQPYENIEVYHTIQLNYDISRTSPKHCLYLFSSNVCSHMDVLCEISRKYGYYAFDFLHIKEMDSLLRRVNSLNKKHHGKVPIEKVGWRPYHYADFSAKDIQSIVENCIYDTKSKDKTDYCNVYDKIVQAKVSNIILDNGSIDIELQKDFLQTLKKDLNPLIEPYNYSRAIGLWLWDQKNKSEGASLSSLICKFKSLNYTFKYIKSEDRVFIDAYWLADESITKGEILASSRNKNRTTSI